MAVDKTTTTTESALKCPLVWVVLKVGCVKRIYGQKFPKRQKFESRSHVVPKINRIDFAQPCQTSMLSLVLPLLLWSEVSFGPSSACKILTPGGCHPWHTLYLLSANIFTILSIITFPCVTTFLKNPDWRLSLSSGGYALYSCATLPETILLH